ncbi:MAG: LysM peptidoglycan-binding domain-containing protein [Candidatus Cloacimonadota bacterium]|nr:LysM peptidoglycan-binding domain-containing protein [Candidatus Cloacimonadota bacterium]
MKKLFALLLLSTAFLTGCSGYNSFFGYIPASKKSTPSEKVELKKEENILVQDTLDADNPNNDSLESTITNHISLISSQEQQIDSLFALVDALQDSILFLNSSTRIKMDSQFPDSIIFAGYTFDLTNERYLEKFKKWYGSEIKYAYKYIPRTTECFPIIENILRENGLPDDMKYLAVAESYLSPFAGSHAGAIGYWQFIKPTAKHYGLTVNHFVDQRQGLFSSTQAACDYIMWAQNYLQKMGIDDMLLAMCSFNAGMGNITRAIREQGGRDFFSLIQRKDETDEYIWRTIAIKYIIENENQIFTKPFEKKKNLLTNNKTVSLSLKGYYKIDDWAQAQGTVIKKVWELNPWIKIFKRQQHRYSPINDVVLNPGNYTVLIPNGSIPDPTKLARIEQQFLQKNSGYFVEHIVKRGENLYNISRRYKTSVSKLMRINSLHNSVIYPGQKLKLFSDSSAPTKTNKYYSVKKGDTIANISSHLGVSLTHLISKNNLKTRYRNSNLIVIIYPGQKLYY